MTSNAASLGPIHSMRTQREPRNWICHPLVDLPRPPLSFPSPSLSFSSPSFILPIAWPSILFFSSSAYTCREQPGETKDLETDPTLQRSPITCEYCSKPGAVFYQDQGKRHTTNMTLFYYCLHCRRMFRDPKVKTR